MVVEGKPDKPTLEEILASIRRITAEETGSHGIPLLRDAVRVPPPRIAQQVDEPEDFELPAMFRHDRPSKPPPLSSLVARMSQPLVDEQGSDWHARPAIDRQSLPTQASQAAASEVPRQMPSCLDTILSRMGQPGAAVSRSANVISASQIPAVPKARIRVNFLVGAGSLVESDPEEDAPDVNEVRQHPVEDKSAIQVEGLAGPTPPIDPVPVDQAAMLRPLLRQWLDENITRVLTQALMDSVKGNDRGA